MKTSFTRLAALLLFMLFAFHGQAQTPFSGTRTVGSGGSYATLTAAFADAAFNGINGPVVFELLPTYSSVGETFPITAPLVTGNSATNTITVRPGASSSSIVIGSANTTSTFDFVGAQYVIIDGRPGGTGAFSTSCLSIQNSAGTAPAIRLINDARYNSIRFCDLQSNNSTITTATSGGGVICFGTTTGTNGNDFNSVRNCDIHNLTGGNPLMGVFAYGTTTTTTQFNDNDSILNCNIYNYFSAATATSGIMLGTGTSGWVVSNNRFFQSLPLAYNGAVTHRAIQVLNTAGSGYQITGNFVGGTDAAGNGFYTMTGTTTPVTSTHTFIAIEVTAGTAATTQINNNTVTAIDFTSAVAGSLTFGGINVLGGNLIVSGNLIGSTTVNGAIKFTTNCTSNVGGVIALRSGTSVNSVAFNNNIVSGIDLYGNATNFTPEFHGINITQTTTTATATGNTVGSLTLANSINLISPCSTSTYPQRLSGFIINQTAASTTTISNNVIANLNTNYSATGTQAASVRGIYVIPTSTGTYTIQNNLVINLTSATQTTAGGVSCAIVGIGVSTTTANVSLIGNTIANQVLTGTNTTAAIQNAAIFFSGMSSGTNLISKNFIRHLSINAVNPAAYLTGMDLAAGLLTVTNNMISLGYDSTGASVTVPCTLRGITKNAATSNLYHNTIFIGGTGVGSTATNTFAYARTASATDDVRNNIFVNIRSNAGTGGKHYQCFLINTTTLTLNSNLYFGNGTGAVMGTANNGTTDVLNYATGWVSGDVLSIAGNPQLLNPSGISASCDLHVSTVIPTPIEGSGVLVSTVTDDYDGQLRSANTPVDIGADAGNFILQDVTPPLITYSTPLANTTSTGDRSVNVTIADQTGVYLSGTLRPRIYFRKASGFFTSNPGTLVSGTANNGTWNFVISASSLGGLTPGDSVYYFFIAQDSLILSNIGSLPSGVVASDVNTVFTNPAVNYGYRISQSMSGNYTIGPSGNYPSITAALADLNSNILTGPVTMEMLTGYVSTVETFPIVFPSIASMSSTNTVTFRPQAFVSGLSIVSNATQTLDFNGGKYFIIDGRPGGSGTRNLTIGNTSTSGVAIRFINEACFNQILHDTVFGVNSAAAGGVILFSTTTGTRGNDSNTVDNCDIKDGATTPATAIYSTGTTTTSNHNNSNNYITNNNIYNFWNAATECNAFKISAGSTDWVMSGNSIFQTAPRTATAAFQQYIWNCNNTGANNHIISNNYIGGSAPLCGGTPYTVNSTVGFRLTGSYLNVGSTVPCTFSNNTFANFNINSGTTSYGTIPGVFNAVWLVGGLTNVTGNTFGSQTVANSIQVNSAVAGSMVNLVGATGTTAGTNIIKQNTFGGISANGTTTSIAINLFPIAISTSTTTVTYIVDSNTIGSALPDNLICSNASVSTTGQQIAGILSSAATNLKIRGNIIRNMRNNAVGTSTTPTNWIHAIDVSGNSIDTISGNQISNLAINTAFQNNNSGSAALVGIRCVPATAGNLISRNEIYGLNLVNNTAATVTAIGVVVNSMLTPSVVQNNYIHGFSNASTAVTASFFGLNHQGAYGKYLNNVVNLGTDSTGTAVVTTPLMYGLYKLAGNLVSIHNSVYLGGTNVGSGIANTWAFYSTAAGTDSIINNVFANERSNSSTGGVHYATFMASNASTLCNSNVYWANGNGGILAMYNTTPCSTLSAWSLASGLDGGSGNANPQFINPTGSNTTLDMHISSVIPTPVEKGGTLISYVTTDMDGQLRSALSPVDIGADAGNFQLLDILPPSIGNPNLTNTALTTDRTFTVAITDGTGLPVTGVNVPRAYYKKFASGGYSSSPGTLISGTPSNGVWSFTISSAAMSGLTQGDSVYVFLMAQDSSLAQNLASGPAGAVASGVLSVTTPPVQLFSYAIVPGFSGIITVGNGGTYASLTRAGGAFQAINSGSLTGNVTLSVISDLLEDGSVMLNQWLESGQGNYQVAIVPASPTLTSIAGSAATNAGLITFNGADRVKIDGRYNGSGRYLSIRNRSTGGSTIRLANDACKDTIMYCFIEGLSNTSPGATVWINTPLTTGNDSNVFIYNVIKDTLNTPLGGSVQNTAFYSNGNYNSENVFSYNEIYNYLYQGVNIGSALAGHDNWVCSGNAFYQGDNARAKTSSSATQAFLINSGANWNINNNSIGGSAADRSGIPFKATWNTTVSLVFRAIEMNTTSNITSIVANNTIGNIISNPAASATASFAGVYVLSGSLNISNNTIGGAVNNRDTIVEGSYNGGLITVAGGNVVNISNNLLGNLYNTGLYTSAATRTAGIFISAGTTVNVNGNMIRDIRSANVAFGSPYSGSAPAGIFVSASTASAVTIEGNTIYNILNNSTVASPVTSNGITISGGVCSVNRNRIYNIGGTSTGSGVNGNYLCGLMTTTAGHTFRHNQITIGTTATGESQVFGIQDLASTGTNTYYYNSVLVNGRNPGGTNNSYAMNRVNTSNTLVWNNIFFNKRSTDGTGFNYACGAANASGISAVNINYNLLVVNDTARLLEMPSGVSNSISAFNSLYAPVTYNTNWMERAAALPVQNLFLDTAAGNLSILTTNAASWYANGKGIALTGVTGDFSSALTLRSISISGGATDIGSVEFNTSTTPPNATASANPALNTTTTYSFANRQVARITWGAAGLPPLTFALKYYSGVNAPNLVAGKTQFNAYVNTSAVGSTGLSFTMTMLADSAYMGNVTSSNNARLAHYVGTSWTLVANSTVNASTGMLSTGGSLANAVLNANFTGTDNSNPLPVEWLNIAATAASDDVIVDWSTANERNNLGFEIERSENGITFMMIGKVNANRNSSRVNHYQFIDPNALSNQQVWYYRIQQVDADGQRSSSAIVRVEKQMAPSSIQLIPNPTSDATNVILPAQLAGDATIEVMDPTGKVLIRQNVMPSQNRSVLNLETLPGGIYLIILRNGAEMQSTRLIRQ